MQTCRVHEQPKALFIFGGPDLEIEPDTRSAAGYMEPWGIKGGDFDAVFDETGRRYRFWVRESAPEDLESTELEPTEEVDLEELRQRLRDLARVPGYATLDGFDPEDPLGTAVALSTWKWEHRWPKRPRWLSRRIHGAGPSITR